jgi:hypothetical protein
MLMFLLPIPLLAGPYQDAQQFGQAGTNNIPNMIGSTSVNSQVVPGYQTSNPPEAQLNNPAALNNAALAGTGQDPTGAGQFIYDTNANNAQFTFSPNDPLITGSNQIQADAYSTMSNLNPANAGATTCVDVVTNTTGIVDTYTCNQSRPGSQVLCSRDLSVSVNSSSSCVLGSLLKTKQMGRFTVKVYCSPLSQIKISSDIQDYYPAKVIVASQSINAGSSGSVLIGTDIIWTKGKQPYTSCRGVISDTYRDTQLYKSGNSFYSGKAYTKRYSYGGHYCGTLSFTPIYFDYTNSCVGSACSLVSNSTTLNYTKQHTVYSYTNTWTSRCQ